MMLTAAAEAYKSDHGAFPRMPGKTEGVISGNPPTQGASPVNPIVNGNPARANYKLASQYLYEQLAGDYDFDGAPDPGATVYVNFKPSQLGHSQDNLKMVAYLQDPYGYSYGYSTSAMTDEECEQKATSLNSAGTPSIRPTPKGFNVSSYDLWSTAGYTTNPTPTNETTVWSKWMKNW